MEHTCPPELAKPATKQKCSAALELWCAQYSPESWAEYGYFLHDDGHWGYFPNAVLVKYRWSYECNDWYNIYDNAMNSMNHECQKMNVKDNKRDAHDADAAPGTTRRGVETVNGASRKVSGWQVPQ